MTTAVENERGSEEVLTLRMSPEQMAHLRILADEWENAPLDEWLLSRLDQAWDIREATLDKYRR
jgi:hypothetical protein